MKQVLHILTSPDNRPEAEDFINRQQNTGCLQVSVNDLTGSTPDYAQLLEAVFRADSIQVW